MNQEEEDQNWLDGIFVKLALEQFSEALQTKTKTILWILLLFENFFWSEKGGEV